MAMGQQKDRQGSRELVGDVGHVFYDRLQLVLIEGGFDGFSASPITRPGWGRLRCHPALLPYAPGGLLRGYRL